MADAELLTKIKIGLGITGTFHDDALKLYIDESKFFMADAGVPQSVIESEAAIGCIMRGVADLWNYGAGNAKLSDYFRMRVLQLRKIEGVDIVEITISKNGTYVAPKGKAYSPVIVNVESGGLPDPLDVPNGTALIAVDGEWKLQDGYGYVKKTEMRSLLADEAEGVRKEFEYSDETRETTCGLYNYGVDEQTVWYCWENSDQIIVTIDDTEYCLNKFKSPDDPHGTVIYATDDFDFSTTPKMMFSNIETWMLHSNIKELEGFRKISIKFPFEEVEKIDKKFIPNELPDPSDVPDGTTLIAVNGKWTMQDKLDEKSLPLMVVRFMPIPNVDFAHQADKTYAELDEAMTDGIPVIGIAYGNYGFSTVYSCTRVSGWDEETQSETSKLLFISFRKNEEFGEEYYEEHIVMEQGSTGYVSGVSGSFQLLPSYDLEDGNILRVSDGNWVEALPELPIVSNDDNGKILKVVDGEWRAVMPE